MKWVLQLAFLLLVASVRSQNTTSSVVPSPTPPPTPPPLFKGDWVVKDDNDTKVCIRMRARLLVEITYWKHDPTNETIPAVEGTTILQFSNDANVSDDSSYSFCDQAAGSNSRKSQITLNATYDSDPFLLSFMFKEDTRKGHRLWQLTGVHLEFTAVNNTNFPNYTEGPTATNVTVENDKDLNFDNELERSFRCDSAQTISLKRLPQGNITSVSVHFEKWRVQAFKFKDAGEFGQARRCQKDLNKKDNTVVPIAVGAALGVLVVIIILAYLFGRFRAHRKGGNYEPL